MLTKARIVAYARSQGAALVGFASVDRFADAPKGHGPREFLPEARSVIVLGMRISDSVVDYAGYHERFTGKPDWAASSASPEAWARLVKSNCYLQMGHSVPDSLLAALAARLAWRLEAHGYPSMPFAPASSYGLSGFELNLGQAFYPWSHRHAAVMAGLGEFGYNNIVLTPEFGPRVRWTSLITEAEFEPDPLVSRKICLREDCRKCLAACPDGALQLRPNLDRDRVFLTPPSRTDYRRCIAWDEHGMPSHRCLFYGTCLRVCPLKPDIRKRRGGTTPPDRG